LKGNGPFGFVHHHFLVMHRLYITAIEKSILGLHVCFSTYNLAVTFLSRTVSIWQHKWSTSSSFIFQVFDTFGASSETMATSNVKDWAIPDVEKWLKKNGFPTYVHLLCKTHRIDGKALLLLTEADLKQEIVVLGDVKHMMIGIRQLQKQNYQAYSELSSNGISPGQLKKSIMPNKFTNRPRLAHYDSVDSVGDIPDAFQQSEELDVDIGTGGGVLSKLLDAELWKVVLSFIYVFCVFLLTSFVMVIVHDRVPDMNKYPPLPDIFLDNIPLIPWAFEACEGIAVILCAIWIVILVFHRHR
jgi:hypothetical protein